MILTKTRGYAGAVRQGFDVTALYCEKSPSAIRKQAPMRALTPLPLAAALVMTVAGCGSSELGSADAAKDETLRTATATTAPTSPALQVGGISWDTEFAIDCGERDSSGIIDAGTEERVGSVGQAWDRIAHDDTCYGAVMEGAENEAETYTFAFEKDPDSNGYFVPRQQYQDVLEYFIDDLDRRATYPETVMRSVVTKCVHFYEESGTGEEYRDAMGEYAAASVLCPGHPQREQWLTAINSVPDIAAKFEPYQSEVETVAQQQRAEAKKASAKRATAEKAAAEKKAAQQKAEWDKATEEAKNHASDGGHYLIGKTLNPGLYRTQQKLVTECYWEISDSQGNIIDNNFINTAPQFDLYIPATAAGFTINGCSMNRVGD